MINKNLLNAVPGSKKYIGLNVLYQWFSLVANIVFVWQITGLMAKISVGSAADSDFLTVALVTASMICIRFCNTRASAKMSYMASKQVKKEIRTRIYEKLLRLGAGYTEQVNTSEVVQVTVEGAGQLETYFGAYLPQFFYSMLAPVTLFIVLSFISIKAAVVLLICVPLIPVSIAAVQTWAKKLLSKYWGQYTGLGDTFLENLQGLTTLKIYETDGLKNQEMNEEAEKFRKITMKVLTMQLNSITIMDLVAYGGAALGIIVAVKEFARGNIGIGGALMIIIISADFFIPMRQLGSFFHIAMNGMAAWGKIEKIMALPEPSEEGLEPMDIEDFKDIKVEGLRFSYDGKREILKGIDMEFPEGGFVAITGKSGCGKSTAAAVLTGKKRDWEGKITMGGRDLKGIRERDLMKGITSVSHKSYLFAGTVRENLLMGKPDATDEEMEEVLKRARLLDFVREGGGLDMELTENGSNLSGGQCQRLAFARAMLKDSPVYIFDEATSNIDVESEDAMIKEITRLAEEKTVIMISHRLANAVDADMIYVMKDGNIEEAGSHRELVEKGGLYRELLDAQTEIENVGRDVK